MNRTAVSKSSGMTWKAISALRASHRAQKAKALERAARFAEMRRTLRGGRRYDPTADPFKRMIRDRQGYYLSKRLRRVPATQTRTSRTEPLDSPPDYLRLLEQLRNRQTG